MSGARGLRIGALVVPHHHIDEEGENEKRDQRDDDADIGMERVDLLHDRRDGGLKAELPGLGHPDPLFGIGAATQGKACCRGQPRYHSLADCHPSTPKALSPVADSPAQFGRSRKFLGARAVSMTPTPLDGSKGGADVQQRYRASPPPLVFMVKP